jgi:iron complex outermembrane recepter protein
MARVDLVRITARRSSKRCVRLLALIAIWLASSTAAAALVGAEPSAPILAPFPAGVPAVETQVVLQLVIDARGSVESAVETSRAPRDAPDAFALAAIEAVKAASFTPSSRDGQPIRSRVEYVVVFHPPPPPRASTLPSSPPLPSSPTNATPASSGLTVYVQGVAKPSPRGLGDVRIDREILDAAPHQQTSEMLSAAPGFFVDHEDGEGLGNDVYLRGFDLDSGSGIEMKIGEIPINVPLHIHGQGYADVNFIIPEIVRSIRVLEGPYDPRQGDSAIVGSAYFSLGVPERGYQVKTTYGSFGQARIVGIAAPKEASDETFVAFSLRETHGFGQDRASQSASINAQYGVDLGSSDHLRVLATAYTGREALPGVVRQDDVNAGRVGYYDAYASFNAYFPGGCSAPSCSQPAQGVQATRVIVGAELDHASGSGASFEIAPWVMWTDFRSRQNYTGSLDSSNLQPQLASLGDLWQLTNVETAGGVTAHARAAPVHLGGFLEVVVEPGVSLRAGHTDQAKSLLNPTNLDPWDYRQSYGLDTIDLAGYVDLDVLLWKKLRVSGGVRADLLAVSVHDNLAGVVPPIPNGALAGSLTDVSGIAPGPRVTVSYQLIPELTLVVSAGEGFRSLDAGSLTLCNAPALKVTGAPSTQVPPCTPGSPSSQVTSFEAGFRSDVGKGRFTTTLAAFQTDVANELVFEVSAGGLTTERASTRQGVVGSFVARPAPWLLASSALSIQRATFDTLVVGGTHDVPNVPAVLWRADVNAHGELFRIKDAPLTGRAGVGYTLLGGRHVNDQIIAPTNNVLNALAAVRYRLVEVGLDMYNVLGLKYADDEEYYVSNWSNRPGQQPASNAVHIVAAPPRTALATLRLYL